MLKKDDILIIIYQAIDELNLQLPSDLRLPAGPEATLTGEKSVLDSLGLINLLVAVEGRLEREHALSISLTDAFALSDAPAFETVGDMADFIARQAERDG